MRKYDAVIFDLDGTLLNTLDDLADSVNYIMESYGYEKKTIQQVRSYVGDGIRKLLERCLGEKAFEALVDEMFEDFMEYYQDNCQNKTAPYRGMSELVKKLRDEGYKLAVVSNKADAAVKELIPAYFPEVFKIAVGESASVRRKPAPDTVMLALEQIGVEKEKAVFVGDSQVDVKTAENTHMDGIFVTWGFRTREVLEEAGAKAIVDTPDELYEKIMHYSD